MRLPLPYVAGFIDGEGCIRFSRARNTVFPCVIVVNTNLRVLRRLQKDFGGDIYPIVHRKINWKPSWGWRISWKRAVDFCEAIHPYVYVKRDQIDTVIAWKELKEGRSRDKDSVDLIIERMHWLNKKGPNSNPDPIDRFLPEGIK